MKISLIKTDKKTTKCGTLLQLPSIMSTTQISNCNTIYLEDLIIDEVTLLSYLIFTFSNYIIEEGILWMVGK